MSASQLNATASIPGSFTYTPSPGTVLNAGPQTLSVTFTPTDTATYTSATASVTLTVNQIPIPSAVSWSTPAAITYGTALSATQLNATASVAGSYAYIPSPGTVLSVGSQTLSVIFTPTNTNYAASAAITTITINQAAPVLSWTAPAAIPYGTALSAAQLNATANTPGTFSYTPSQGTVLSLGSSTISVTFIPADTKDYTTPATASVPITVNKGTPQITWVTPAAVTYGVSLSGTQQNATANVPGTFAYAQSSGTVYTVGSHPLSVTFTPADSTDYNTATAGVTLLVNQATPVINWAAPAAITYGTALSGTQLNAGTPVPGSFTYSPASGTVPAAGTQTLSATFTPTDATNYTTANKTVQLAVNQVTPSITWAAPTAITYGTALSITQLNASSTVAGTFSYSPASGMVLTAGTQTLSTTFTPTDTTNYATTNKTVQLTVNQATPSITWATPAAITYDTALDGAQLNASSTLPGTFTYSPIWGTVLSAGTQTLSATFTPTDATDYATAAASVTLTVNKATTTINWGMPAFPIAVGAPLSSGQLNATAASSNGAVAGTFVYSPAAGYIYTTPGTKTLTATFTPADTLDYTTPPPFVLNNVPVSSFGIVCWGDSMTEGDQGSYDVGTYPGELAPLLTLPVVNMGYDGQISTQIGVRQGAIPTYATITGGVIPASGSVTVTFPTNYVPVGPWSSEGPLITVSGTILGIHGTVAADAATGTIYTFTRTTPGSAVSAPGSPQFIVDTPYAGYLPIIWSGRNNYDDTTHVLSDIAAMVATIPPGQNYLVMSITNTERPIEFPGGKSYPYLIADNTALAAAYGAHFLDIWQVLINSYDPSLITDVTDYNHHAVPSSLRAINFYTKLASAIGPTDTTITLTQKCPSSCVYGVSGVFIIDYGGPNAETISVAATTTGNPIPVLRAVGGVATSHAAGAPVVSLDYIHLNSHGDQIVANAVAQYLSAYAK